MSWIVETSHEFLTLEQMLAAPKKYFPQDRLDVLRAIFKPCRPDARVAFGSRRKDTTGTTCHYLAHVSVDELLSGRDGRLDAVLGYEPEHTQYFVLNPQRLAPLWMDRQGFPMDSKPKYFPVKNETVAEVRALFVDLDVGRPEHGLVTGRNAPKLQRAEQLDLVGGAGIEPATCCV